MGSVERLMMRREFMQRASAAIALLTAHEAAACGPTQSPAIDGAAGAKDPLIRGLRLLTATPIPALREF